MGHRDRFLYGFLLSFFCPFLAFAQYTTVTGTVTDVNGLAYASGQMKAQLVLNGSAVTGQPTVTINNLTQCNAGGFGSAPCKIPFPGTIGPFALDGNGNMPLGGVQFQDNNQVTPAGTQWLFTVNETPGIPPPGGTGPQTCTATITITGATQNVTAPLSTCPALSKITGGGGGGSPTGNNGDLQMKAGAIFAPSHINDNGNLLLFGLFSQFIADTLFRGPNPYVDVRAYGVRSVSASGTPVLAGITATMSAGNPTATVSTTTCPSQTANICFQNGDGVVVYGAGATNTLTTPAAPTVTASLAASSMNASNLVNAPAGSTTYNYQIVLRDTAGGLTAASPIGSTATGQTALGAVQVNVTSLTRTNNSVAVVTASPINLSVGTTIFVTGSTDSTFSGMQKVQTVTDTTHFTYLQGMDTRAGASTSATGGTVQMYACNKIVMPAYPTNGWQYYVYGRTGGSLTLIGVTKPLDTIFEDYGSPMMDGISLPSYVPNTPPGAATNDQLSSTILSGGGTSTLTLANNAINSVAGTTIKLDHGPNLLAAIAANPNGFPIYIPDNVNLIINSYTNMGANVDVVQSGLITLYETLANNSSLNWNAENGPASGPTFGTFPYRTWDIRNANPGFFSQAGGGTRIFGVNFQVSKQGTGIVIDDANSSNAGFNQAFEWCAFTIDPSGDAQDYTGMGLIIRGDSLNFIDHSVFSASMPAVYGASISPLLLIREDLAGINPAGSIFISDTTFQNRAMTWDSYPNGFAYVLIRFTDVYGSGIRMPFIMFAAPQGGTINLDGIQLDTSSQPFLANVSNGQQSAASVRIFAYNVPSGEVGGGVGMLSGNPFASVTVNYGGIGAVGQNFNLLDASGNFFNNHVFVNYTGTIGFAMATPAAPTLTPVAGGTFSPSNLRYGLTALDLKGNETPLGPLSAITIPGTCPGAGNCSVMITPPAAPIGSLQYRVYRSTNGGGAGLVHLSTTNWGTNFTDTGTFLDTSGPPVAAATSSGFTSAGLQTYQLQFSTTPFASLGTPANGFVVYCPDCTIANPCAGGGTGAIAKRLNGVWVCN
jgi:hypothetical protein